jgi:hypothetical protein
VVKIPVKVAFFISSKVGGTIVAGAGALFRGEGGAVPCAVLLQTVMAMIETARILSTLPGNDPDFTAMSITSDTVFD